MPKLIWRACPAPPAGPGIVTSVFAAIRFHSVTALPAGWPRAEAESPATAATSSAATASRAVFRCMGLPPPLCLPKQRLVPAERGVHTTFGVSLEGVPTLSGKDADQLFRFVDKAESLGGDEPFTSELPGELARLVPADCPAYNELDRVRRRNLLMAAWPVEDDENDDDDEISDEQWDLQLEHPVCHRYQQGFFVALKLSDFLTQKELHRTYLYELRHRPLGIEYEMG